MKNIYSLILKEKHKQYPNREYIQFLQQLLDQENIRHFVSEYKQKLYLEKLFRDNTIEMNDYFKDSGQEEKSVRIMQRWVNEHKMVNIITEHLNDKRNEEN